MKSFVRTTSIYIFSLFILSRTIPGVKIEGDLQTYIIGGLVLAVLQIIIKPILNILTLPFHFISFGFFSVIVNVILLYLLTVLVPDIRIYPFVVEKQSYLGFVIPRLEFNSLFAYMASSLLLSSIVAFIRWLFH